MNERIAVVISTYNNPEFLRLVLSAYAKQGDKNFSIYIADDGSSVETREMIQGLSSTFPVPIHHVWHEDQGFRKAHIHNLTFQHITEPYIILTDGDCIPLPNMIATHRRFSEEKTMICGSRILLSKTWTQQLLNIESMPLYQGFDWVRLKYQKKINRLLPLFIPPYTSNIQEKLSGIHGCHFACFKSDLFKVNGFDESFEGWGREDSDLVARLFHIGVQRKNLRGSPVLHLWHAENSRSHLSKNDDLLKACLDEKRQRAIKGIEENILEKDQNQ
ncbi:MAG: glycosyltransferase family 2 protein [Mariprofundaceae bacterium]|nr:glycosyltransferase family 2 protein [Mariprofundaceae bacterium]